MSKRRNISQVLLPGIMSIGLLFGLCPVNAAVVEFDSGTYYPSDPNADPSDPDHVSKPSYSELVGFLNSIVDDPDEPPIIAVTKLKEFSKEFDPIIYASDGNEIAAVKISDQPHNHDADEPDVLFVGGIHGNEPLGVRLLLELIEFLTENYDSDPEVRAWVDAYEIWIIPVLNPSGFDNVDRNNLNDVDLNRNFDFLHSQSESTDKGAYEFSAPESRALGEFVLHFRPVLGAIFHSGADNREIMRPWSPEPPPADATRLFEVADVFAAATGTTHMRTGVGGSIGFSHAHTGMFDFIIEMDPVKRHCSNPYFSFFCDLEMRLYAEPEYEPEYWLEKVRFNITNSIVDNYLDGIKALLDYYLFDSSPPFEYTGPGLTGKVFDCVTGDKITGATIIMTGTAESLDDRDGDGLIEDYDDRNADALDFAFSLAPGGYRCPDAAGAWVMHDYSDPTDYTAGTPNCAPSSAVALNEIVVSTTSTDREFVELAGNPGDSLDDLFLLEVGPDGEIHTEHDLSGETIPVDGFWLAASPEAESVLGVIADYSIPNNTFTNESRTYLLVDGFTGTEGDDIDGDDDGHIDDTPPWLSIVDSVALIALGTPLTYSPNVVGPKGSDPREPDGSIDDDEEGAVKFRTTDEIFGRYLRLLPRLLPLNPTGTADLVTDWDVYVQHPDYIDWHSIVSVTEHETGVALQELDIALDSGVDSDGDVLTDCFEIGLGTNPYDPDTDDDGLWDYRERTLGTNPLDPDSDVDGLNDGDEVDQGTDPLNPDSDADLLQDGHEVKIGTDPLDADTDDDGLSDGQEVYDYHTNPLVPDTDEDGLSDGQEVNDYGTYPLDADSDDDGLTDGEEVNLIGTDPMDKDADDDGILDGSDPDIVAAIIAALPPEVFLDEGEGLRTAMLAILENADSSAVKGKTRNALVLLSVLRSKLDGCDFSVGSCDDNDWIIDCNAQLEVRYWLDHVIASLQS